MNISGSRDSHSRYSDDYDDDRSRDSERDSLDSDRKSRRRRKYSGKDGYLDDDLGTLSDIDTDAGNR